jgi:O-antigen/teichoic acid export membrane protein
MTSAGLSHRNSSIEVSEANHVNEIGRKSARGGIISLTSNVIRTIMQLIFTAVLSRLLSIDDYGSMAMSSTIIYFFALFSDIGLGGAAIQRRLVDQQILSTLFWIGCFVGLLLCFVCWICAPLAGVFYHDDRLVGVIALSSVIIPLGSLGSQHLALLTRQARWKAINAASIVSQIVGGVLAMALAYIFSIGYWALAVQSVSAAMVNTAFLWFLCRWRPGWPTEWGQARSSLSFGGYLMAFVGLNYVHRQMDNVIVGRSLGSVALGFYSRGYNLFMLPLTAIVWPIASVVQPLLSRQQDDPHRFALTYGSALASVYLITLPFAGGLYLFSDECVTILYGQKWHESSDILHILAIAIVWQPAFTSAGWIEISLGRTKRHFQAACCSVLIYLVAFIIGVKGGTVGMAKAYVIANMVVVGPWLWWATRGTAISLGGILTAVRGSIVALGLSVGTTLIMSPYLPGNGVLNFFGRALFFGIVYLCVALVLWKIDHRWAALIRGALSKLVHKSQG